MNIQLQPVLRFERQKKDKSRALKPNLNSEKDHETKKFPDPKAHPSFKAHESRPLVLLWALRTSKLFTCTTLQSGPHKSHP